MDVELGWGRTRRRVTVSDRARVLHPPDPGPGRPWPEVVAAALAAPVGSPPLAALSGRRICVLVPDNTRKALAERALPLLLPHLAGRAVSVGIAAGKHPPSEGPPGAWVHDAHAPDLVPLGRTAHGTDVRFPREVVEADLRVLVGEIRPHYFAGYAGGYKALFPGAAGAEGIWRNHELKAAPGARLGVVEGNPCRADFEAAAAMAGPCFLLNVVRAPDDGLLAAVAGEPIAAHREGVRRARAAVEVPAPSPAGAVLVSDADPVTMNLYQACKLLPPAGRVLRDGGTIVMAAACHDGIGPVGVINEGIYRLGVVHALPPRHRVVLVSEQPPEAVAPTFAEWAPSVEAALAALPDPDDLIVMPRAGDLVPV